MFFAYKNLILHLLLSLSLTTFLNFFKIPVIFLHGLNTYIHPEDLGTDPSRNGVKARIRRPDSSNSVPDPKKRNKSKEKFDFDENNAQIFRLKLVESHIESRLYFYEYFNVFNYSFVAISCVLLHKFLNLNEGLGVLGNGTIIPVLLGSLAVFKVFLLLMRVSIERSASRQSDKQLSVGLGILGFLLGLTSFFPIWGSILEFNFESVDGFGKFCIAILMGCVSGFLFMPTAKCARAFWLGTDQLGCNLSIISCGMIARWLLYGNYLIGIFASMLWITPFAEIFVNKNIDNDGGSSVMGRIRNAENLVGNVGMARGDFVNLRLLCLFVSGVLQIVTLRSNLQMYLNEAVLSWYQRLHASRVPDLDFSWAKVFLHNHYLCLAVLQFFAPAILVLLFLSLSQIDGSLVENFESLCGLVPCSAFTKEVVLFMAWWVIFIWAILTSTSLVLYRRGSMYVS